MPSCRISCFRSELGERDRLQEVIAENERLRAALDPFAAIPIWRDSYPDGPDVITVSGERFPFSIEAIHAARTALRALEPHPKEMT